ncbi:CLAVATA3/ESR (CLE)-related protein 5-like [Abrus precatorius]|uniref:CLAVATA3/ESR (CLE)-related protein 5-like n=1 Tax=Abrus precatorius TaxID=3816 RepID=A0A8B8KKT9_ABRPR|nr:CLAVATA3/ESR (CLE)-related protein 5-like [Abrus precatorius]
MANATVARVSILVVLIILFTSFFMTLQARNLQGHPNIHENAGSTHRLFHKLSFDLSKHLHVQDDDVPHKDGNEHRLTPEGPDPHHNATPPRN